MDATQEYFNYTDGNSYGNAQPVQTGQGDLTGFTATQGGYNPTGDQGGPYTSQQGTINGQNYYSPVAFNPSSIKNPDGSAYGLNQNGYINFGSNYNPAPGSPGNTDYTYSSYYQIPNGQKISYGSLPENQIAATNTVGTQGYASDPTINGVDYTQGASYANMFANSGGKMGTANPDYGSFRASDFGQGGSIPPTIPYTQYTEPGYKAPQYSSAAPQGQQSYGQQGQPIQGNQADPGVFYYGNNGSAGSLGGTFANNTPGQSSAFYQNQPASLTQGDTNPALGQFTSYNPLNGTQKTQASNPGLQALTQSRSQ